MDRIDEPRIGWYAVRRGGRWLAAAIYETDDGLAAVLDGRMCAVEDVWISNRREISRAEYDYLASRHAVPATTLDASPDLEARLLRTADAWRHVTITDQIMAGRAKDLARRLRMVEDAVEAERVRLVGPLLERQRAINQEYKPRIEALRRARAQLISALTSYACRREAAEMPPPATAMVDGHPAPITPMPPAVAIHGSDGRAASLRVRRVVQLVDWDAAMASSALRMHPELVALAIRLASRIARQDGELPPGFTIDTERTVSL